MTGAFKKLKKLMIFILILIVPNTKTILYKGITQW